MSKLGLAHFAAQDIGTPPCQQCEHAPTCGKLRLACAAYASWVRSGKAAAGERKPDRQTWSLLFEGEHGEGGI